MIEAITEDLDRKLEMWRELDELVKDDAYLATNTSSLSVATQADATKRPERMIGLHFFNPPQVMPLLEVVRAEKSGDDAVALGFEVGEKLGKTTVAAGDNRGFIVNRLLVPYMLDAIRAHEQGVGSIEDIDTGMMAGASHPMGPLTLADFVGLDTLAAIAGCDGRRLRRGALRRARHAQEDGRCRGLRPQVGQGVLRLLRRQARPGGRRGLGQPKEGQDACQSTRPASTASGTRRSRPRGAATTSTRSRSSWRGWPTGSRPGRATSPARTRSSGSSSASASGPARSSSQAEESAQQIRAEAEEEARGTVNTANMQADGDPDGDRHYASETRLRRRYAQQTRQEAEEVANAGSRRSRQARETIATAQAQARRIVEDGTQRREDIEAVIADLVRRRNDVLADTEELSAKLTGAVSEHRPEPGSEPFEKPDEFDPLAREDEDEEFETGEHEAEAEPEDETPSEETAGRRRRVRAARLGPEQAGAVVSDVRAALDAALEGGPGAASEEGRRAGEAARARAGRAAPRRRTRSPRRGCLPTGSRRDSAPTASSPGWGRWEDARSR